MPGGHLQQDAAQFFDVRPVGHPDRQADAHLGIAMAPVRDLVRDQIGVGHDDRDVIIGDHGRAAEIDFLHEPRDAAHFNPVADGNGPLGQENEPAHKIADDVLQAKAEAHAKGSRDHRQGAEIHAVDEQGDIEAQQDKDISKYPADRESQTLVKAGLRQQPIGDQPADHSVEQKDQRQSKEYFQHRQHGDGGIPQFDQGIPEPVAPRLPASSSMGGISDRAIIRRRGAVTRRDKFTQTTGADQGHGGRLVMQEQATEQAGENAQAVVG